MNDQVVLESLPDDDNLVMATPEREPYHVVAMCIQAQVLSVQCHGLFTRYKAYTV